MTDLSIYEIVHFSPPIQIIRKTQRNCKPLQTLSNLWIFFCCRQILANKSNLSKPRKLEQTKQTLANQENLSKLSKA